MNTVFDVKENKFLEKKRTIQQLSVDARLLYERLVKVEGTITYKELNEVVGGNVQEKQRGVLTTARKMAESIDGIVFGTISTVGLKRLNDSEIVNLSDGIIRHVRRSSRKGISKISKVADFNNLSNEDKIKHNASLSILGVFAEISKPKKIGLIEKKVAAAQDSLSLIKTLEAFKE